MEKNCNVCVGIAGSVVFSLVTAFQSKMEILISGVGRLCLRLKLGDDQHNDLVCFALRRDAIESVLAVSTLRASTYKA